MHVSFSQISLVLTGSVAITVPILFRLSVVHLEIFMSMLICYISIKGILITVAIGMPEMGHLIYVEAHETTIEVKRLQDYSIAF